MKERLEKQVKRGYDFQYKGKKKIEILEAIANGDIDIVIGTHSLIEDNVVFKKIRSYSHR